MVLLSNSVQKFEWIVEISIIWSQHDFSIDEYPKNVMANQPE